MRLRKDFFWNRGEVFVIPDFPDLPIIDQSESPTTLG
jgi:hypothetical protein